MQAGLKTGMYYLRTRAAADAIKFTVDQQALARSKAARAVAVPAAAADNVLKVCSLRLQHLIVARTASAAACMRRRYSIDPVQNAATKDEGPKLLEQGCALGSSMFCCCIYLAWTKTLCVWNPTARQVKSHEKICIGRLHH